MMISNVHSAKLLLRSVSACWRLMSRKLWLQASVIQVVSALLVTLFFVLMVGPSTAQHPLAFEMMQAGVPLQAPMFWLGMHLCLVSLLAKMVAMPVWWRWIHVLFPLAVVLMLKLSLPPLFYLSGFTLTLLWFWSVHNTRVPFYPSFPATWHAVLQLCDQQGGTHSLRVLDIGSGLGDVAMFLAKHRLQDTIEGIEIAPMPWLISWMRARLTGSSAHFTRGNYQSLDFSQYQVIFAYLSPAVMQAVWQKVALEMPAHSVFISCEFPVEGVIPHRILQPTASGPALYVYQR